jgi:hypothetical protein
MGVFTSSIFGNDLAADVRDEYLEVRATEGSIDAAVKRVRKVFAEPMRDADDRRIVFIAMAATQSLANEISEDVRTQALKAIAWCESPLRDPEDFPFDLKSLISLRETLGGAKAVAKPSLSKKSKQPALAGGELVAVSLPNDGGELLLFVAGPSKKIADTLRIVWLFDTEVDNATEESVHASLKAWRNYRQVWPNGLGRRIGCYDAKGALTSRKMRVLLRGISLPPEFDQRMNSFGELHKASDLPWVVEHDQHDWKSAKWVVDPEVES